MKNIKRPAVLFVLIVFTVAAILWLNSLGDFLNPALALLGQGLKKSPIGQKLDFANHSYLCKGLLLIIKFHLLKYPLRIFPS
jgi:hypothetical protein